MKIFITSYASYNAGTHAGQWYSLEDYADNDELLSAAADYLNVHDPENNHEELFFTDWENIPAGLITESGADWSALFELAELDEDDRSKIEAYDRTIGDSTTALADKLDAVVATVEPCPTDREWRNWCTDNILAYKLAAAGVEASQETLDILSDIIDGDYCVRETEHDYLYDRETGHILYRHA